MKHKKYIILILLSGIFLLNACQKDIDIFVPDPGQNTQFDTNWVTVITDTMPVAQLKRRLQLPYYTDSFLTTGSDVTVQTTSMATCIFSANSLVNLQNQPASGVIYIKNILLKKKGDIIRMDKPTTSDGNEVASGGEVLIKAIQDGNELSLSQQSSFDISYTDTTAFSPMKLFYGDESAPSLFNWLVSTDSNFAAVNVVNRQYRIKSNKTGWLAAGQPLQSGSGQGPSVSLTLPNNFTNANTMAYLVNRNVLSVIKMNGQAAIRKFTSSSITAGNQYVALVISIQGGNYFLGYQNLAASAGTTSNITVSIEPSISNFDTIIAHLNNL